MDREQIKNELEQVAIDVAAVEDPALAAAVGKLLNLVERLVGEIDRLQAENDRLKKQDKDNDRDQKDKDQPSGQDSQDNRDVSSEKARREREQRSGRPGSDARTFKDLPIHETIACPVDPQELPPDAERMNEESFVVQDLEIRPHNIEFLREVYYSPSQDQYYLGPLPGGYQTPFGAKLKAAVLALKYAGNMSEPKILEFLQNFGVQISAGTINNILTHGGEWFAQEKDDLFLAGLESTPYQQIDDTSARVGGEFWHSHIVCNPFYTAYFTTPHKDRLTILDVLQNGAQRRYLFHDETRQLLEQMGLPGKWLKRLPLLHEQILDPAQMTALLDEWFGEGKGGANRDRILQAAAIAYYHHQQAVPVVQILVCDDAKQFKLVADSLALCWIHAGRHYAKLSPIVPYHQQLLETFLDRYWDFYERLQRYRDGPTTAEAESLRQAFEDLFSTETGYEALDDRIAKTRGKASSLLTVLDHPEVPLHNNASELGARVCARRRDVSLQSKSRLGVRAMDTLTTIVQTCKKLGVSAYEYFADRLSGRHELPSLATLIRRRSQLSTSSDVSMASV